MRRFNEDKRYGDRSTVLGFAARSASPPLPPLHVWRRRVFTRTPAASCLSLLTKYTPTPLATPDACQTLAALTPRRVPSADHREPPTTHTQMNKAKRAPSALYEEMFS